MPDNGDTKVSSAAIQTLSQYSQIEFWLNLVFQRGALAVAEVAGTVLLFRNIFVFEVASALLGAFLLTIAIVFEYLIWTKTTVFVARRVDQLESVKDKAVAEQLRLITAALQARPQGAQGAGAGQ